MRALRIAEIHVSPAGQITSLPLPTPLFKNDC